MEVGSRSVNLSRCMLVRSAAAIAASRITAAAVSSAIAAAGVVAAAGGVMVFVADGIRDPRNVAAGLVARPSPSGALPRPDRDEDNPHDHCNDDADQHGSMAYARVHPAAR